MVLGVAPSCFPHLDRPGSPIGSHVFFRTPEMHAMKKLAFWKKTPFFHGKNVEKTWCNIMQLEISCENRKQASNSLISIAKKHAFSTCFVVY